MPCACPGCKVRELYRKKHKCQPDSRKAGKYLVLSLPPFCQSCSCFRSRRIYYAPGWGDCFCLPAEAFFAIRETPCSCGFQGGRKLVARILKLVARILKLVACFFKYVRPNFFYKAGRIFLVEIFVCKKRQRAAHVRKSAKNVPAHIPRAACALVLRLKKP